MMIRWEGDFGKRNLTDCLSLKLDTAKGAAGGRSDVAKCNEPPSAGRKTSDRPPIQGVRAEARRVLPSEARAQADAVPQRSFAHRRGGRSFCASRSTADRREPADI